ncbi:DUF1549 domain-containing protein [Luteolibacter sp. Populi]|uniref:DUF1549 domain-containing protein n=1 Tax=Luteolibacter sp. Populi TaxID=3230487 RepID=UPI003465BBB0
MKTTVLFSDAIRAPLSAGGRGPVIACLAAFFASAAGAGAVDFAHQVVPLIREHCGKCHTGDAKKGGFSMNTRESLLEGSENGAVLEAGKADDSLFLEVLHSDDKSDRMPPKGARVPAEQLALLRDWINEGVTWEPGFTFGKDAYEPPLKPRRPEMPPVADGREHPVDRLVDAYFKENKIARPQPLEDAAFIRRLSLDLVGLMPSPEEVQAFVADTGADKRERLVTAILARDTDYAEHWLSFWNDLLRNDYQGTGYIDGGRKPVTKWLYQSLVSNKPYDTFARELLAPPNDESRGFIDGIQWRGSVNASQVREVQFAQSISQTFLGLNMKCASCHDSFVDRWKLDQAYGLAAIYANAPLEIARCDKPTGKMAKAGWIFPELGEVDATAPQPERLKQLAGLMTHPDNGRFTRTIVNRLWHRLMGRGIVHPVDAMDTAPWSEDLLDYLAVRFTDDGYDLKKALAVIVSSEAYQSQCVAVEQGKDPKVFRGPLQKRMSAEQFVDAVWSLTGTAPEKAAPGVPRTKAGSPVALTAKWIWSDAGASASAPVGETLVLATEVELPAAPVAVPAVFIADNEAEVYVNGVNVASEKGSPSGPQKRQVELGHFRAGRNTLMVVARNGGTAPNPAGVIFEAHARMADGRKIVIASGDSWKTSVSLPDSRGRFVRPPRDWKPAAELASPGVWDRFVEGLADGLAPAGEKPMVRASLVNCDLLMRALGRPNREQIVSMRPDNITTLEAIDLANGEILAGLLQHGAEGLGKESMPADKLVETVFLRALGRRPSVAEKGVLVQQMGARPSRQSVEDLLWLVLVLPEFQFVR